MFDSKLIIAVHLSLFITDGVALVSITIWSIDRLSTMLIPIKYRIGIKKCQETVVLISPWPLTFITVAPYFQINFIKEMAVFCGIINTIIFLSMILLSLISKWKLKWKNQLKWIKSHDNSKSYDNEQIEVNKAELMGPSKCLNIQSNLQPNFYLEEPTEGPCSSMISITSAELTANSMTIFKKIRKRAAQKHRKTVTRAFMIILFMLVATYIPTCLMMVFMNVSTISAVNCQVRHTLRDLSVIGILTSSVVKPICFILTLKHLQNFVKDIFVRLISRIVQRTG